MFSNNKNIYEYKGLEKLNYDINHKSENFFICMYQINNSELYPFLEFILNNNDCLSLIKLNFSLNQNNTETENIIDYALNFINNLLNLNNKLIYDKSIKQNQYKGSLYYKNNTYLFFDITNNKIQLKCVYKKSPLWFALIDEIVNVKHICNIKIDLDTINFFTENIDFLFLKNQNNINYETPTVVYVGKEFTKINYTYVFGVSKTEYEILGPYYYFTNFKNAIKEGLWNNNKNVKIEKGGIIRFAIFTGLMKIILNNVEDPIDKSIIKRELLKNKLNNYENLTLRITDYDGKWVNNYDSAYIGNLELDNGEKIKKNSIYVVKNDQQQLSLSYHYINTNLLDELFDPNKEYEIM